MSRGDRSPAPRARALALAVLRDLVPKEPEVVEAGSAEGRLLMLPVRTAAWEPGRDLVRESRAAGWRFLWVENSLNKGATLDLRRTPGGRPLVSSYSFGTRASWMFERLAELRLKSSRFSPSLVRIPELRAEALVQRDGGDIHVLGLDGAPDGPEFLEHLARRRTNLMTVPAMPDDISTGS